MPQRSAYSQLEERCASYDLDGGRCQLVKGHGGSHAVAMVDRYLTWDVGDTSLWSGVRPPLWIFDLPWAAGLQPRVPDDEL